MAEARDTTTFNLRDRVMYAMTCIFVYCIEEIPTLLMDLWSWIRINNERFELICIESLLQYLGLVFIIHLIITYNKVLLLLVIIFMASTKKRMKIRRNRSKLRSMVFSANHNTLKWLYEYLKKSGFRQISPPTDIERVRWFNMVSIIIALQYVYCMNSEYLWVLQLDLYEQIF